MPIFDMQCKKCKKVFEFLQIQSGDWPTCPKCGSKNAFRKLFSMMPAIRMDSDTILKSLPDPVPPLEELRGRARPDSESGLRDKPEAKLSDYKRKKDKLGNTMWFPKERMTIDMGRRKK